MPRRVKVGGYMISICALAFAAIFMFNAMGCMNRTSADPLTKDERAWLTDHDGKIRLAHDPDARPIEYVDKEGRFSGLAADYIRLIEKRLDFKFDILKTKTWDEALQKAKNKEADVLCAFTKNREREQWMLFTEPYIVIKAVILTRDDFNGILSLDNMQDKTITFTKGWVVDDYLRQNYSQLHMLPAVDPDAAMHNLITKKADAWVTALTVASIKIEDNRVSNIRIAGDTDFSFQLSIASRKDWPILNSILKKGLSQIPEDEKEAIFKKWIKVEQGSIFESRKFWTVLFVIFGGMVIPVFVVVSWNKALKRKVAEKTEALLQSESRQRALVNTIPDLVWLKDQDGVYISCNRNFEQLFGAKESEIVGKTDYDFVDKDLADFFRAHDRNAMQAGRPSKNEEELTFAANGYSGLFETIKTPMFDSKGKIIGVLGIARDITERKRSENEILKQKRLFETMFNTISDCVVITNTRREIQLANKGMESTFGYKSEELIGRTTQMLYADQSKYHQAGDSVFNKNATNPEQLFVTRYRDKNGREFPGETFGAKLFDENNQWIGNLGVIRDITEREQAEIRIQQAQKMESIGNLAGGIAHDFNNILFPIVGMAELLLDDLAPDSQEYMNAEEIYRAGKRGSDLVKQILAFSRQSEHKKIPVRVQHVLAEVLKLCRSTIPANIEITQSISDDCGMVLADATQIHQIAMNLITNAYHAVESTGEGIFVQLKETVLEHDDVAHSLLRPGRYAMVTVSDAGCGIDPKLLNKIFDPYFTTKGQGKGTGLGLAVAYGIVKEHNGDINVYSEVGKGTTFNVYLPLMEKSPIPVSVEKIESSFTGSEHILLVDDEEPIMRLEKQILERLGYHVTSRISSVDALDVFKDNPDAFDLVISDMTMPNMTGDQFARKLLSVRPDIPIIICTGFSERIGRHNAGAFGIKGLLMKPIVKSEMARMIRKVLDEANGADQG